MIEGATLIKLLDWAFAAKGAAEAAKNLRPKSWTNVEARFAVEEIGLGFSCDDKSWSPLGTTVRGHTFRVTVIDPNLEKIVYMEGENSDESHPKVAINVTRFSHDLLREMFQMARCMREFERTDNMVFATKYQSHRDQVLFLWKKTSEEGARRQEFEQRIIDVIAETFVDAERSSITLDTRLIEDLGAVTDLDFGRLAKLLEDEFNIELTDDDIELDTEGSYMWYVWYGRSDGSSYRPIERAWVIVGDVVACIWNKTRS